ncbi:hypothetical protein LNTAR_11301 [Lentisphaera araneosa HTCC2155]|uniref:DUF1552 domain-containing protein n=1 Tax=Lentisphaera araneosa HTCC2155 TaxID=313628 RepID=A6DJ63_9BACT|nr:DUF1552 domain-containing protein [Lentisphaera araneosa]EDM28499.1 hypothetical protein LNTAR_11301 [Lentisphaera araneosa HTCC2155]
MNRRTLLRGAGVALALPNLELFADVKKPEKIRRFVGFCGPLGVYPPTFFPQRGGKDYQLTETTQPLEAHKKDITIFKNLDHGLRGGHKGIHAFLSGVKLQDATSNILYPEKNISLDQKFADAVGHKTRFHSFAVCPSEKNRLGLMNTTTWTKNGIAVPNIEDPLILFNKLFKQDSPDQIQQNLRQTDIRKSILDAVLVQSKTMNAKLGRADQQKMDQYFTSIRELEQKIQLRRKWINMDKPRVRDFNNNAGSQDELFGIFFELLHLALTTDSTRSAVFHVPFGIDLSGIGVDNRGYHGCSHHGKSPEIVADLKKVDTFLMKTLSDFIAKLKESQILDDTVVLFGSGMSDGSPHSNECLPVIVAGGGFNHGEHKIYSTEPGKKIPLCNLYLTILQSLGLEIDRFSNSTGTINSFGMV